ncbi:MAG: hypothetical protein HF978_19595 [Desulfobacteraceae bacterium]|nr:hypothetical protein [Desulfobacteraceae bacterium]MBC2757753.1 hypothetical protein [Desulfobacteraceae bacterium]
MSDFIKPDFDRMYRNTVIIYWIIAGIVFSGIVAACLLDSAGIRPESVMDPDRAEIQRWAIIFCAIVIAVINHFLSVRR